MGSAALQADASRAISVDIYPVTCYIRDQQSGFSAGAGAGRTVPPIFRSEGR
jgi:hypothetical protein